MAEVSTLFANNRFGEVGKLAYASIGALLDLALIHTMLYVYNAAPVIYTALLTGLVVAKTNTIKKKKIKII